MATYNYKVKGINGLKLDMLLRRQIGRTLNISASRIREGHPIYFTAGAITFYQGHNLDIIANDSTRAEAARDFLYNLINKLKLPKK